MKIQHHHVCVGYKTVAFVLEWSNVAINPRFTYDQYPIYSNFRFIRAESCQSELIKLLAK